MPLTARIGIRLVKKLPGPMITASSSEIAPATTRWICTGGSSQIPRPRGRGRAGHPRPPRPAPWSRPHSARTDWNARCSPARRGRGSPRSARRPSTPARKLPLYCSIIDRSRLPAVCPARRESSSVGNRDSRRRRASRSLRASARAHLSTSPGGSTPSSSRNCPELPPLSNMVTMAFRSSQGFCFKPPSTLGRPVPPPKQPTFITRRYMGGFYPGCAYNAAMRVWPGRPHPLGTTWDGLGVNVAVFSENATAVEICLFDSPTDEREAQRSRSSNARITSGTRYLPDVRPGQLYGFRVHGPYAPHAGHRFNPSKIVLDPYAKAHRPPPALARRDLRLRPGAGRRPGA